MTTTESTSHQPDTQRFRRLLSVPHAPPEPSLSELILRSVTGIPDCNDARQVEQVEAIHRRIEAARELSELFAQFPNQTIGGEYYTLAHTD